jgi:Periplasmic binding protein-like domain
MLTFDEISERTGLSISTLYRIRGGKVRRGNRQHEAALKMLNIYDKQKNFDCKEKNIICLGRHQYDGHTELLKCELENVGREFGCRFYYHDILSGEEIDYNSFDGCILIYTPIQDMKFPIPTVGLNRLLQNFDIPTVSSDDVGGMMKVFQYLKKLGHKRIGFLDDYAMRPDYLNYRRAVIPYFYTINDLAYDPELVYSEHVEIDTQSAVIGRAVDHFCGLDELPSAIVMPADSYSAIFYEQFKLRGIKIPEDISFTGYDCSFIGEHLDPPLTTVQKPFEFMAKRAVELLIKKIENPKMKFERILLEPELVVRKSVADLNNLKDINKKGVQVCVSHSPL